MGDRPDCHCCSRWGHNAHQGDISRHAPLPGTRACRDGSWYSGQTVLTIGQLCRRFGLSRSTLLYYDRIGLLHPTGRSASNYRLYSDADVQRMERIIVFRQAGIALAKIGRILDAGAEACVDSNFGYNLLINCY